MMHPDRLLCLVVHHCALLLKSFLTETLLTFFSSANQALLAESGLRLSLSQKLPVPVTHALRRLRDDIAAYMGSYIEVIAPLVLGPKKQRPTEKQEKTEKTEADGKTENTYFPTRHGTHRCERVMAICV